MTSLEHYDLHTFAAHGTPFAVDGNTGATYRLDDQTAEELQHPAGTEGGNGKQAAGVWDLLRRLTPRARAVRQWRYPITWEEAYIGLHCSVFCNLACRYCQAREHRRTTAVPDLDPQAAREVMDWAVLQFAARAPAVVFAFGISGEPLLAWDLFEALYEHGVRLAAQSGKRITWGLNTNGLLLSERLVADLEERPDVALAISLDGPPEAHDAMRRTRAGAEPRPTPASAPPSRPRVALRPRTRCATPGCPGGA